MKSIVLLLVFLITAIFCRGQVTTTDVQQVDLYLVNVISMKFLTTGTSTGSSVNINLNNMNYLENGRNSPQQWLSVNSTKDFNVTAKANSTNFSYSGSYTQNTTMPVSSALKLKLTANNTGGSGVSFNSFSWLTDNDQTLISGGDNGYDKQFRIRYKGKPGLQYPSGVYTVQVVFTATQL